MLTLILGAPTRRDQNTQMDHHGLQCDDGDELASGAAVGGAGREGKAFSLLNCWDVGVAARGNCGADGGPYLAGQDVSLEIESTHAQLVIELFNGRVIYKTLCLPCSPRMY